MTSLWQSAKWVLVFFLGSVLLPLAVGIGSNYLYGRWKRENEFGKIWEFCKSARKLVPRDFRIQGYRRAYISRESDTKIESLLENGEYVLITGKPKIGKTRASYEAIRKFESFSVVKLRPGEMWKERIRIPSLNNRRVVLFLDDLQHFAGKDVEDVIDRFKKTSKKLVVVATCRTGEELDLVTREDEETENLYLYREFAVIELKEITELDRKKLTQDIRKTDPEFESKPDQFDGTPGSVTLDLGDMKERYKRSGRGRVVLRAMKLLKEGNLFPCREDYVRDVCISVFDEQMGKYVWDGLVNNLKENGFVTRDRGAINIYPPYLEGCVYDYEPPLEDLRKLQNLLVEKGNSGSLLYLGNSFCHKKRFIDARNCYSGALRIYPQYAAAHTSLGYVLTKLGGVEEAKGRYEEAQRLYQEAIEEHRGAISIDAHHAVDHNNLGYSLASLGEIAEIRGKNDEAKRLYEEAEKEHRTAIGISPHYSSAHRCLAYALGKLGRVEEAEKELREAIRIDPGSPFAHNLLGYLLTNRFVGRDEEAEREYAEAIRLKPDYPSGLINSAYLSAKLGRWEKAEQEYREVTKAYPDYILAYANLGHSMVNHQKRYEEAAREYGKALRINPNYAEAHNGLGYVLVNLKRYHEAENEYGMAIRLKPVSVEAHRNLGYLLAILGRDEDRNGKHDEAKDRYDEAEKEYRKALQIEPDDEDTLICLGVLLEKVNRNTEAENCYKKVIERNPSNVVARQTYGYFLSWRGRGREAIEQFHEVTRLNPDDAKTGAQIAYLQSQHPCNYASRGRALIDLGDLDGAERDLRQAIELNPNKATAPKNLGILQERRGDRAQNEVDRLRLYEDAEKEYRRALELDPMHPSAHRHLAGILVKLGRYGEAEAEYNEVKKILDNYPKNNRDFGIFLSKIGRTEEAKKELELALESFTAKGNEGEAAKIVELLESLPLG
ncbi:MAG TPA: tetratricopeptide repeat protein [Candidatus Cryosericum sp.]